MSETNIDRSALADELLRATTRPDGCAADRASSGVTSLAEAYAIADETRPRLARGERLLGYKIGFTNRSIWQRYGVHAPIWGPVWDRTVAQIDGTRHTVSLARSRAAAPGAGDHVRLRACTGGGHGRCRSRRLHRMGRPWLRDRPHALRGLAFRRARHRRGLCVARAADGRSPRADCAVRSRSARRARGDCTSCCCAMDEVVDEGDGRIVLDGPLHALRMWVDAMAAQPHALADRTRAHRLDRDDRPTLAARAWRTLADEVERERLSG